MARAVSSAYRDAIAQNSIETDWTLQIVLKGESNVITLSSEDIDQESLIITESVSDESNVEFGTAYTGQLEVAVHIANMQGKKLYGARMNALFSIKLADGTWYSLNSKTYTVDSAKKDDNGYIKITAYDDMRKLNKRTAKRLSGNAYSIIKQCCDKCGVTMMTTEGEMNSLFANASATMTQYLVKKTQKVKYVTIIKNVLEYLGGFATIKTTGTKEGLFVDKYYNTQNNVVLNRGEFFDYRQEDYLTQYSLLKYTKGKNDYTVKLTSNEDDEGLAWDIGKNEFFHEINADDLQGMMKNLFNEIHANTFLPFEASMPIDPSIEVGDTLYYYAPLQDENGDTIEADSADGTADVEYDSKETIIVVTNIQYNTDGSMTLKCGGANPDEAKNVKSPTNKASKSSNDNDNDNDDDDGLGGNMNFFNGRNYKKISLDADSETTKKTLSDVTIKGNQIDSQVMLTGQFIFNASGNTSFQITYTVDDKDEEFFNPKNTYSSGNHVETLYFPIVKFGGKAKETHKFKIGLKITSGKLSIDFNCFRITIYGENIDVEGIEDKSP